MKFKNVFVLACGCNTANTNGNDPTCELYAPPLGQCSCAAGFWGRTCDAGTPYGIINIIAEGGGQGDTRLKLKNWTHPKKKC